jgi:hypothetical protein
MQAKGRLQDAGAPQTVHILELGKKAIPMLIACLNDETRTKEPIEDFWPVTTVGDIAFFYLCDLFTDSTWEHSTIDGVVTWKTLSSEYPDSPAWDALHGFVKKHGRHFIQAEWSKKWQEEKSAIFWDVKERCFKIGPHRTTLSDLISALFHHSPGFNAPHQPPVLVSPPFTG